MSRRPLHRPRREPTTSSVCTHRLSHYGGRCPVCYRNSMREYSRNIQQAVNRPRRPAATSVAVALPPITVFAPPLARPVHRTRPAPRVNIGGASTTTEPRYQPSNFLSNLGLRLPGRCILKEDIQKVCSICMNNYETDKNCQILPCKHAFHAWCVQKWFMMKRNCPLCRKEY